MYKPARHVSFDATKKSDRLLMVRVNAVAMARGEDVASAARVLLAIGWQYGNYGADEKRAAEMMGL